NLSKSQSLRRLTKRYPHQDLRLATVAPRVLMAPDSVHTTMKRFPIRNYGDEFLAGRCANGEQALLGLLCPNLVLYRFDADGNLIGREVRPWRYHAEQHQGVYAIYDPVFREHIDQQIADWQAELGFVDGRIEVEAF